MPVRENNPTSELQATVVTFRLGGQTYALPIAPVRQIIEMVTITPLPHTDPTVAGVINFHGRTLPVIVLRRLLGLAEAPLLLHTPIILANISERLVGLIVDDVMDVLETPADQIVDPSDVLLAEMGEIPLLQGLIQARDGSILLLNPDQLLRPDHVHTISEAIDALNQSLEQAALEAPGDSQPVEPAPETPQPAAVLPETAPDPEIVLQKEPALPPDKPSKSHRKKTAARPKNKKEVSA